MLDSVSPKALIAFLRGADDLGMSSNIAKRLHAREVADFMTLVFNDPLPQLGECILYSKSCQAWDR